MDEPHAVGTAKVIVIFDEGFSPQKKAPGWGTGEMHNVCNVSGFWITIFDWIAVGTFKTLKVVKI